jgi:hypothetical protein
LPGIDRASAIVAVKAAVLRAELKGKHPKRLKNGSSSIGRAAVSKTACWGFKSLLPCFSATQQRHPIRKQPQTASNIPIAS